jgi:hypothetical protein
LAAYLIVGSSFLIALKCTDLWENMQRRAEGFVDKDKKMIGGKALKRISRPIY